MSPSKRLSRFHAGLYSLAILLLTSAHAAADESSSYLPLAVGKQWTLRSEAWNVDIAFEVEAHDHGAYQVRMNNPWIEWSYAFVPFGEQIYMQSFHAGDASFDFGGYIRLFDFALAQGDAHKTPLGPVTVTATDKVVVTATSRYENCIELTQVAADGFEQRFTFAPDVGFVEYRMAGGVFVLDEDRSVLTGTPERFALPSLPAQPRGNRVLGIDVTMAEDADYLAALETARNAGMQEIGMLLEWNAVERAPGDYDTRFLEIADSFFHSLGLSLNLTLAPIHNVRNTLPADLQALPLDHPDVIARYQQLLDAVFATLPNIELTSLVVGSEIDAFLLGSPERWQQFENFFRQVADFARARRPGLPVTTEFHFFTGLLGPDRARLLSLMAHADVIGVTYYPLDADDSVLDPAFVDLHFGMLRDTFPGKPINFYQIGFPSSTTLGSSETLQEAFISRVFHAWDTYADAIKLVDLTWLHDRSPAEVDATGAQFGQDGANFAAFIGSLGLRGHAGDGVDKLAMPRLRAEAAARGW